MTAPSTASTPPPSSMGIRRVATIGLALAVCSSIALVASGFGYRFGWWGLHIAFTILKWSAYGGVLAGVVSLVGATLAWRREAGGGMWLGVLGLFLSLVIVGVPWSWLRRARSVPPIHDITTDTNNPPAFVAVLPLRANAPNKPEYGGTEIAAKQLAAYPDLKPVVLAVPAAQAFQRALAAARGMGWEIVAADSASGRIEATATTFWYGFKDDVVIRVTATPANDGARIDVRSESRVGGSDVGTNAQRIRAYLKKLAEA